MCYFYFHSVIPVLKYFQHLYGKIHFLLRRKSTNEEAIIKSMFVHLCCICKFPRKKIHLFIKTWPYVKQLINNAYMWGRKVCKSSCVCTDLCRDTVIESARASLKALFMQMGRRWQCVCVTGRTYLIMITYRSQQIRLIWNMRDTHKENFPPSASHTRTHNDTWSSSHSQSLSVTWSVH